MCKRDISHKETSKKPTYLASFLLHVNKNQHRQSNEFVTAHIYCKLADHAFVVRMRATIRPYNPSTSAKIRIRIMPTNSRGCCAVPLTPASPTTPMAKPAARPDRPTLSPAPNCRKALYKATNAGTHGLHIYKYFLAFNYLAKLHYISTVAHTGSCKH